MELSAAPYFYTVATISVTFTGFSTLFTIFRQMLGGRLSRYEILLTRNFLQFGFIVIIGSLLPSLLALFVASASIIWRISGMITIVPLGVYVVTYPARRRAATGGPMPMRAGFTVSLLYLAIGVLLVNVVAAPVQSRVALHALGVTIVLFAAFLGFLAGLDLLLTEPALPVDEQSE